MVQSKRYEVRVRGTIPSDVLEELGDNVRVEALTVVTGNVRDQSALHSVLRRLQNLGVDVVALRTGDHDQDSPP